MEAQQARTWKEHLLSAGRGAVILATELDKEEVVVMSHDLGMHSIWVELGDAENLSMATYAIGTELLLDMGPPAQRGMRGVSLDSFRMHVSEALDLLANDLGHVLVLDGLDPLASSDATGFHALIADLVNLFNVRLGWYSYPTNPSYHLFDPDGPAWVVVLIGSTQTLERAAKTLEGKNREILDSPHYWVSAWNIPVPIRWLVPN